LTGACPASGIELMAETGQRQDRWRRACVQCDSSGAAGAVAARYRSAAARAARADEQGVAQCHRAAVDRQSRLAADGIAARADQNVLTERGGVDYGLPDHGQRTIVNGYARRAAHADAPRRQVEPATDTGGLSRIDAQLSAGEAGQRDIAGERQRRATAGRNDDIGRMGIDLRREQAAADDQSCGRRAGVLSDGAEHDILSGRQDNRAVLHSRACGRGISDRAADQHRNRAVLGHRGHRNGAIAGRSGRDPAMRQRICYAGTGDKGDTEKPAVQADVDTLGGNIGDRAIDCRRTCHRHSRRHDGQITPGVRQVELRACR
jgi:hypothetical protein